MKVLVLLSGGMDSVTALYHAREEHEVVGALSFDYGSKHNACELECAKFHAEKLGISLQIISLDFIQKFFTSSLLQGGEEIPDGNYAEENMKSTVVPFRNGIMLSVAAGYAESRGGEGLVIAAHSGDHAIYPDCREDFMRPMAEAIEAGTYVKIKVLRPFIHMNKAEIAKEGARLGVDFSHTWSCYKGGNVHCGTCGTCVERKEAFVLAGILDPTNYK